MDTTTEVVRFELQNYRDDGDVGLTIFLNRHPANRVYGGNEPEVSDLPQDFRIALNRWLDGP